MRVKHIRLLALLAAILAVSRCSTDVCACPPVPPTALVYGRVTAPTGEAVPGTVVRAYSAPAPGCHADGGAGQDYGVIAALDDGSFSMGLAGADARDSICVFVFARPDPHAQGLTVSDTTLVLLDFGIDVPQDSAHVDLVLRAL
ncbi:MAG TPA: hypothetical protein VFD73_04675 [Gemmatimonadales bacterium]|jgi:hypothetical protein|nr:hypothetical protein [Gemmatimonadales bacterium]